MVNSEEKNILDMIFVKKKKKKKNALSFSFEITIYFCKCKLIPRFVRQGKIPFVPLFMFIEEIVMKVLTTKRLIIREDNDERNFGIRNVNKNAPNPQCSEIMFYTFSNMMPAQSVNEDYVCIFERNLSPWKKMQL